MKRYWLSILLVPFIVAGIGSHYYVQAAAHNFPEFVLQRQAGDERIADEVTVRGSYGTREFSDIVSIRAQGSEYSREQSLVAKFAPDWRETEVGRLYEQHRQLMRGKNRYVNSFYEDKDRLAYVNVEEEISAGRRSFRFQVSILDKTNNRTASYEAPVPNGKLYRNLEIKDVQIVGEQVKVMTVNYRVEDSPELHLYTLGMQGGQTPKDAVLSHEVPGSPGVRVSLEGVDAPNGIGPSRFTAIVALLSKEVQEEGGGDRTVETGRRLLIYDVEIGREVKIDSKEIEEVLSSSDHNAAVQTSIDGNDLYLIKSKRQIAPTL